MDKSPFLIAGGGIAGLAASLGLARVGRPARVFEQRAGFDETGAGLQMSPNAVRALQWLGAWDAVAPFCVAPAEIHIRSGSSGAILQRIRLGMSFERRYGAPYRVAHRADLMAGLVAVASANNLIALHSGAAVAFAEMANGASLTFGNGRSERGTAVIAADGIHSKLRQQFWPASTPSFRGHAIHRALVPMNSVPCGIAADCVTLWLCPRGHVVHYPVSKRQQFNIVAAIDSPWCGEEWQETTAGGSLRTAFADAATPLAALLAVPQGWTKWASTDLAPLDSWTTGKLVLTGDAAHACLPYLAQGAAMALEDACVLATCLAAERSPLAAFSQYESMRKARTANIQIASRRLASHYHADGLHAMARNLALRFMGPDLALGRSQWIYGWKA